MGLETQRKQDVISVIIIYFLLSIIAVYYALSTLHQQTFLELLLSAGTLLGFGDTGHGNSYFGKSSVLGQQATHFTSA